MDQPARPSNPAPADTRVKVRLRFRKGGDLRLVSHHDLMHCFERMMRRADLPICVTKGFHPQPRIVFAQSLALGVAGLHEVVELELTHPVEPSAILEKLNQHAPPGIEFLTIQPISMKAGARVRRAFFRLSVPALSEPASDDLQGKIDHLLSKEEAWVARSRPQPRSVNLRPFIQSLSYSDGVLTMALWVTANGAARPDEIARLLGLDALLDGGAWFERVHLELLDEVSPDDPLVMPAGLGEKQHSTLGTPRFEDLVNQNLDSKDQEAANTRHAHDAASRSPASSHSALIPGPLSFDS